MKEKRDSFANDTRDLHQAFCEYDLSEDIMDAYLGSLTEMELCIK